MASVAIVGGGISGLVCANRLAQLGIHRVSVFDTGKNAAGGRCSSRSVPIQGQLYTLDHSCQYFTVGSPQFAKIVSFLLRNGAVQKSNAVIGQIDKSGRFSNSLDPSPIFVGTDGVRSIAKCLSTNLDVRYPVWIGDVAWSPEARKWKVDKYGYYDYLIIAHNGKCADKLMANAGAPKIHRLLQVRFSDTLNIRDQRMHLSSIWVLMIAFSKSLHLPYTGAHTQHPHISWICNNTEKGSKLASFPKQNHVSDIGAKLECWTIMSTASFGSQYKAPQEHLPPKVANQVTERLLESFCEVIKKKKSDLSVSFSRVQLWGAALPLNVLDSPDRCIFDGGHSVGVCGDWCASPCIEGAALSGIAVAERIHKHTQGEKCDTSLIPKFKPAGSTSIGAFPRNKDLKFETQPK